MKTCTQCVMDESDPSLTFNNDGICNQCEEYQTRIHYTHAEKEGYLREIEKAKTSNSKYNCLIGLSGGLDSTYLAIHAVKDLGLKPLAIHMDNGWNTGLANCNIYWTVKKLGLPFIVDVLDWEEFRKMQLAVLKAGVPDLEAPTDLFINFTLRKYAKRYGIKLVLSGSNPQTEGVMSNSWSYGQRDPIYIKSLYKSAWGHEPKKLPLLTLAQSITNQLKKTYTVLRPLKYTTYGRKIAIERSRNEVNWTPYERKHGESFITRFYQDIFLPKRFNADKRKAHYSALILNEELTREQALFELKKTTSPTSIEADIEYLCMKLEISRDQYEKLVQQPIKSYRDYQTIHKTLPYRTLKKLIAKDGPLKGVHDKLGDLLRR